MQDVLRKSHSNFRKLEKEKGERVLESEICLFCNLYDLFTHYSVMEVGPTSSDERERVL